MIDLNNLNDIQNARKIKEYSEWLAYEEYVKRVLVDIEDINKATPEDLEARKLASKVIKNVLLFINQ